MPFSGVKLSDLQFGESILVTWKKLDEVFLKLLVLLKSILFQVDSC